MEVIVVVVVVAAVVVVMVAGAAAAAAVAHKSKSPRGAMWPEHKICSRWRSGAGGEEEEVGG